jgi:head-tail adaptor
MPKEPSKYDRRIGFERQNGTTRNALNEIVEEWVLLGQTLAHRTDVRDVEKARAGREASALMSRFEVRSTALTRSLSTADRLVVSGQWDEHGVLISGEVWDIDGVKEAAGASHVAVEITAVKSSEDQV